MTDLLTAYDANLRTEAEMLGASEVERFGPLWVGTFPGRTGFVSYRNLDGADIETLVSRVVQYFSAMSDITEIEWKTRSHDGVPELHEALIRHGFAPASAESVMIGDAAALAVDVPLPDGVTLRRISEEHDLRRMVAMQNEVFGSELDVDGLIEEAAADPDIECWIAEAGEEVVSAGRLHPVTGTVFAGIWGGATQPAWRGRGVYRALTAARARSALRYGKKFIHSDSTEYSRPILERHGFVKVTETTPYVRVQTAESPSLTP